MKMIGVGIVAVLLAGGLVFTTGACGGGTTSGGVLVIGAGTFTGNYCLVSFRGEEAGVTDVAETEWGNAVSDGLGALVGGSTLCNENGVVGAATPVGPGITYTVDPDHTFRLLAGGMVGWEGGITADGRAALLASITAPLDPQIILLLRKGGGVFGLGSLSGAYHFCSFFHNAAGPSNGSEWGTVTFDGGGNSTWSAAMTNLDGATGPLMPPANTYMVMADGSATVNYSVGLELRGGILLGGDLVILAGGATGGSTLLMVLIRKGAGLGNGAFNGTYRSVSMVSSGGAPWTSVSRSLTADGAGNNMVNAGTRNQDGVISPIGGFADTYMVGADGTLTIGGGAFVGGISPGGDFAMFAGGTGGGDPQLHLLVR